MRKYFTESCRSPSFCLPFCPSDCHVFARLNRKPVDKNKGQCTMPNDHRFIIKVVTFFKSETCQLYNISIVRTISYRCYLWVRRRAQHGLFSWLRKKLSMKERGIKKDKKGGGVLWIYFLLIWFFLLQMEEWADPGGTAIPGPPVVRAVQALSISPSGKNQFNIEVLIRARIRY